MDPMVFLNEKNSLTRMSMHAIARQAHEDQERMDHNLAVRIVNGVANLFKAG